MKKLFTILTTLALICVVGCEEQGDDNVNPNDKPNTEQPGEKPDDGDDSSDTDVPYCDQIQYISTDGCIVIPHDTSAFGVDIVSNTYEDDKGIITFNGNITSIGDNAFQGCASLTGITIPDSVTEIGKQAFDECSSLTSITIPDSVTEIGEWAFYGCTSLTSITIPDSVTEIWSSAFDSCSSLTTVTIPDSVTSIEESAFSGCTSLKSIYGKYASNDGRCLIIDGVLNSFAPAGLTEYTIPDSVTSIGYGVFAYCSSLTSITIPDSVTSIGVAAFSGCTSLASVTIGNGVTYIGGYAFYGCTSLTSVYCKATTPPSGYGDMFDDNASGRKIYVPRASVDAYKAAEGWSEYADSIEGYDFE